MLPGGQSSELGGKADNGGKRIWEDNSNRPMYSILPSALCNLRCGLSIVGNVLAFQAGERGSRPLVRSNNKGVAMFNAVKKDIVRLRQNGFCIYCGKKCQSGGPHRATLDHIRPSALGGTNHVNNLVLACYTCNHERDIEDFISFFKKKVAGQQLDVVYERVLALRITIEQIKRAYRQGKEIKWWAKQRKRLIEAEALE